MRTNRSAFEFALAALIVLCATTMLFAVTIRGSSANGEDSGAPHWLLLGRSKNLSLSGNGKTATMRREIVCPNQDVENAQFSPVLTLSGSCDSGTTMLIYQLQSTASNLAVTFKSLAGFDGTNANNFGVMICDSPNNTIELCTNAPASAIPNITTTTTKSSVTFTVPGTFPTYSAGTAQQGQGLTFFVILQATGGPPLPLGMQPTVTIQ
jgi:hypothetical protein